MRKEDLGCGLGLLIRFLTANFANLTNETNLAWVEGSDLNHGSGAELEL